jgi:glycosyltransferase involved in cell wall biosynthesis
MKVSVLIPIFNGERYLPECLDSILEQSFQDMEILISDDGSTDGSLEIIKQFAARDSRIRWWKNPKNLGMTGNSNVCLKAAQGDYIKFLHQDDKLLSPLAIQKMASALDSNPRASLVVCQRHYTNLPANVNPATFSKTSGCFSGRQVAATCFEKNDNLIGEPSLTLFRRVLAQRGFDGRLTYMWDWEMWWHLLGQGDFVYIAEPLATWRFHSEQVSETQRQKGLWRNELLVLYAIYMEKPWFKVAIPQQTLIEQSRFLQQHFGPAAADLVRKIEASVKPANFLTFWVDRKRNKLKRWLDRKREKLKRWRDKTSKRSGQEASP